MYEYDRPDWKTIYPDYEKISRPVVDVDACYDVIDRELTSVSTLITDRELRSINRGLSINEFKPLYRKTFPDLQADLISIDIYKDGNYAIVKSTMADGERDRLLPVFITFRFYGLRDRDHYREKLREYEEMTSTMEPGSERSRLFHTIMQYQDGHKAVCVLHIGTHEYDFFETSNTVVAKHRVAVAMDEFYGAIESKESAYLINTRDSVCLQEEDLTSIIGNAGNNLCNLYSLAYVVCRLVCDSHLAIWEYFKRKNRILLVYLIAGLYK